MQEIKTFTIKHKNGMSAKILNLGGVIQELLVPSKNGEYINVVLNYNNAEAYRNDVNYLCSIVGRYANRIADGRFSLDDHEYNLLSNNSGNHLHGGMVGFNKKYWTVEQPEESIVLLSCESFHMEEGYPGHLLTQVKYEISINNKLLISYLYKSDRPTIVNLTQHAYFNLSGKDTPIYDHWVKIDSARILEINTNMIPTGKYLNIENTPFDFTHSRRIGDGIYPELDTRLVATKGYDNAYVFEEAGMKAIAEVYHEDTGITMKVRSTSPSVQLYSGNFLGQPFIPYAGLCLETQYFPDSPNHPEFPSTVIREGEEGNTTTIYSFEVD